MREILFRGKRENNGEWVEGFYVARSNKTWIYPAGNQIISKSLARELRPFHSASSTQKLLREVFPVDPDTVGQYTGLMDKNGKRIFEGDCISHPHNVVEYLNGEFCVAGDRPLALIAKFGEVIGNIHDNPELLEGN